MKQFHTQKVNHHKHATCHVDVILNQRLSVSQDLYDLMNMQSTSVSQVKNTLKKALFPSSGVERATCETNHKATVKCVFLLCSRGTIS